MAFFIFFYYYYKFYNEIRVTGTRITRQIWWLFCMELKFLKSELHDKLKFQNSSRSLIILQTMVKHKISAKDAI